MLHLPNVLFDLNEIIFKKEAKIMGVGKLHERKFCIWYNIASDKQVFSNEILSFRMRKVFLTYQKLTFIIHYIVHGFPIHEIPNFSHRKQWKRKLLSIFTKKSCLFWNPLSTPSGFDRLCQKKFYLHTTELFRTNISRIYLFWTNIIQ